MIIMMNRMNERRMINRISRYYNNWLNRLLSYLRNRKLYLKLFKSKYERIKKKSYQKLNRIKSFM